MPSPFEFNKYYFKVINKADNNVEKILRDFQDFQRTTSQRKKQTYYQMIYW